MKRYLVLLCASLLFVGLFTFWFDFDPIHDIAFGTHQTYTGDTTTTPPTEKWTIPEPARMFLLGSGLIGVGVFVRRKFKR